MLKAGLFCSKTGLFCSNASLSVSCYRQPIKPLSSSYSSSSSSSSSSAIALEQVSSVRTRVSFALVRVSFVQRAPVYDLNILNILPIMPFFGPLSPCKKKKSIHTQIFKVRENEKIRYIYPGCSIWQKKIHAFGKRDLCMRQKRPTHVAKETYACGKRYLYPCQKRPIPMPNQIDTYANRDLCIRQKRPIHMAKETYT